MICRFISIEGVFHSNVDLLFEKYYIELEFILKGSNIKSICLSPHNAGLLQYPVQSFLLLRHLRCMSKCVPHHLQS